MEMKNKQKRMETSVENENANNGHKRRQFEEKKH